LPSTGEAGPRSAPDADIADSFNYGFTEASWERYRKKVMKLIKDKRGESEISVLNEKNTILNILKSFFLSHIYNVRIYPVSAFIPPLISSVLRSNMCLRLEKRLGRTHLHGICSRDTRRPMLPEWFYVLDVTRRAN
jgi:hypothetical protein